MSQTNFIHSILSLWLFSLIFFLPSCVYDNTEKNIEISTGDRLPDFEVILNDGQRISSSDFSNTKGIVIFFNTDCKDCRRELPELQKAYEATKEESLWIAIARAENDESIAKFWESNNISIPYSPQSDRQIYELFSSTGIPRLYITDGSTIRHSYGPDNIPLPTVLIDEIKAIR